eukprot:GHUV01053869.1.p2 GENE.GHUV01053869.1~~GHUV01053869.1.p2  ORF type:complete len:117 (-),score=7.59 GHUV01053869.1:54-404(-)
MKAAVNSAVCLLLCCPDRYEANHAFSDYANWLVPGTLLVGRYPYVEPSRCKTYEKGEQQLQEILNTGVTTFISLQVGCRSTQHEACTDFVAPLVNLPLCHNVVVLPAAAPGQGYAS